MPQSDYDSNCHTCLYSKKPQSSWPCNDCHASSSYVSVNTAMTDGSPELKVTRMLGQGQKCAKCPSSPAWPNTVECCNCNPHQ